MSFFQKSSTMLTSVYDGVGIYKYFFWGFGVWNILHFWFRPLCSPSPHVGLGSSAVSPHLVVLVGGVSDRRCLPRSSRTELETLAPDRSSHKLSLPISKLGTPWDPSSPCWRAAACLCISPHLCKRHLWLPNVSWLSEFSFSHHYFCISPSLASPHLVA